jgi:hypothetical protein
MTAGCSPWRLTLEKTWTTSKVFWESASCVSTDARTTSDELVELIRSRAQQRKQAAPTPVSSSATTTTTPSGPLTLWDELHYPELWSYFRAREPLGKSCMRGPRSR